MRRIDAIMPLYAWFRDCLRFVGPDDVVDALDPVWRAEHPNHTIVNAWLQELDTGIERIEAEQMLVSVHRPDGPDEITRDLRDASGGVRRLLAILPAISRLTEPESKMVYVIDDLDLHLHPSLSRWMIEAFFADCYVNSRAQLIMTCRDATLVNPCLLRRGEIGFVDQLSDLSSEMYSLSQFHDFKSRSRWSQRYLFGHFGGSPRVVLVKPLCRRDFEMEH